MKLVKVEVQDLECNKIVMEINDNIVELEKNDFVYSLSDAYNVF